MGAVIETRLSGDRHTLYFDTDSLSMRVQIAAHNVGDGADKIGNLDIGHAMVAE